MAAQQNHDAQRRLSAWLKAHTIQGYEHVAHLIRKDAYGKVILWNQYGITSEFGWEIDHELPEAHFPSLAKTPVNLRALHWRSNRSKSDRIDLASLLKRMQ